VLGRASPPPGSWWREATQTGSLPEASEAEQRRARQVARDWGRFTRNFVIQASAADWAAVWLSGLRAALLDVPGAELVFFQHDEVIVHCPAELADDVAAAAA
jgi:DNA polymerase I